MLLHVLELVHGHRRQSSINPIIIGAGMAETPAERSKRRDKALEDKGLKRHKVIIPNTEQAIDSLKQHAEKLIQGES